MSQNTTNIQKFYAGKNIFITGATGFLGKILIEKLLWSCRDIGNIYILMREKKGKDISQRIDELFDAVVYQRVLKDNPSFKQKIKVVIGDCEHVGLGLSFQDKHELIRDVNVVFHVAATVRFHEPLNVALNVNVRATQDMVELAKEMKGLVSFIHVSTAYSHCYLSNIAERFYEMPMDPLKLLKFVESTDQQIVDDISQRLLGKWPNTYSFSKAMAEDYLRQCGSELPLGIFRPSIVTSSMNEPVPRWADNWYGINGYITACGAGLLRVINANPVGEANVVPVDMCINAVIASAWDVAECRKNMNRQLSPGDIRIYNYALTNNPIRWGELYKLVGAGGLTTPPIQVIWYYCLILTQNSTVYNVKKIIMHWIPAAVIDAVAICVGKKAQLLSAYRRIHKMENAMIYFTTRSWNFTNDNVMKLIGKMSDDDRRLYQCDLGKIKWKEYFASYFLGLRRYLLKDDDSTIPSAAVKYRKLYWMHKILVLVVYVSTLGGIYLVGSFLNKCIKYHRYS